MLLLDDVCQSHHTLRDSTRDFVTVSFKMTGHMFTQEAFDMWRLSPGFGLVEIGFPLKELNEKQQHQLLGGIPEHEDEHDFIKLAVEKSVHVLRREDGDSNFVLPDVGLVEAKKAQELPDVAGLDNHICLPKLLT